MSRVIALCLAAIFAASGCSAYKGTVAPAPRAGAMPVWRADGGLAVGVDIFADREHQKAVFDADFYDKRMLALQLMVRNQRPEPVLVRRVGVTLTLPDGHEITRVTAAMAAAQMEGGSDTLAWGLGFGLIGMAAAAHAEEGERTARRADYEAKELREDVILQAGEAAHGFLYFVPPLGTPPFTHATLTVRFADPKESVITPLRVPLSGLRFRGAKNWEDDLKAGRRAAPTPPTDAPSPSTPVAAPSQPTAAPVAPAVPATAAATPSAPARPAGPEAELKAGSATAPAKADVNVAGKWTGTVSTGTFGGAGIPLELNLVQSGKRVSGTISVRNRPFDPKNWDGAIKGAVNGRSVTVEYWTPESRKVVANLTLADDGGLNGPGQVEGTLTTAEFKLRKSE